MENNTWQIDEDLYKVHISADVFEELIKEFMSFWRNFYEFSYEW